VDNSAGLAELKEAAARLLDGLAALRADRSHTAAAALQALLDAAADAPLQEDPGS